jgi:hypothetical protein
VKGNLNAVANSRDYIFLKTKTPAMKIHVLQIVSLLSILLTGCYYSKITLNERERSYIPYKNKKQLLVFVNEDKKYDTVKLHRSITYSSNPDFYIDRKFDFTKEKKRPYYETYQTEVSEEFDNTIKKSKSGEPYIKRNSLVFTFNKHEHDTLMNLYYFIDGRSRGNVYFTHPAMDSLRVGNVLYKDVITFDRLSWSLQHGLIRINEGGGRVWDLVK